MTFLLSSQNVFNYLLDQEIYQNLDTVPTQINTLSCKNFNLSIQLADRHFLVKQECHNAEGKAKGDVANEWRIHQFLETFPATEPLRSLLPHLLHFDPDSAILVSHYFDDSVDLDDFYGQTNVYAPTIAQTLAQGLALLHRTTFNVSAYKDFLTQDHRSTQRIPSILTSSNRLRPEAFGMLCDDGIEFWRLFQRYESLTDAIAHLRQTWQPCCLIHNDLKFNNVLIRRSWGESANRGEGQTWRFSLGEVLPTGDLRLIDWERFLWGDPAFDVATVLASYLKIWLGSLMIGSELDLETALRLAETPLETLQPSLRAFIQTYLQAFPEIVEPGFIKRVMQMTGACLIQRIQVKLEYREPFGNAGICMLQVAKSLLCQPEESISAIFGVASLGV
jgi:hypothetical protein